MEIGGRIPEARQLVDAYFDRWAATVAVWLEAAGDRLPIHTDRRALAAHVLSVLQGGIMQARAAASIGPFDDSVSHLRLLTDLLAAGRQTQGLPRSKKRRSPPTEAAVRREETAAGATATAGRASRAADPSTGEVIGADDAAWWKAW